MPNESTWRVTVGNETFIVTRIAKDDGSQHWHCTCPAPTAARCAHIRKIIVEEATRRMSAKKIVQPIVRHDVPPPKPPAKPRYKLHSGRQITPEDEKP